MTKKIGTIDHSKVSYTAVLLDEESQAYLKETFAHLMPMMPGWRWVGHHQTIQMGALHNDVRNDIIGNKYTLTVISLGLSNMAMAVGVKGMYANHSTRPHITLAVNDAAGAKPKMSNDIPNEDWTAFKLDRPLTGIATEIGYDNKAIISESISSIHDLPFIADVKAVGGNVVSVGGAVRDKLLGKESKDLDIVVTGVPLDKLKDILSKHGRIDIVGISFGIIKFKAFGSDEEIDIALPRKDSMGIGGRGHKDIDVYADHTLPIEADLGRRDITINSIAQDLEGNYIDPYKGLDDIKNKIIRVTNPQAFSEDPLRILRCLMFSSRFDFTIEPNTFNEIKKHANSIKEITKERILMEFEKIVTKGNPVIGARLLVDSDLYKALFEHEFNGDYEPFQYVKRLSEFMYFLTKGFEPFPDKYFKDIFKGDIQNTKDIRALNFAMTNIADNDQHKKRWFVFEINKISSNMLNSHFITSDDYCGLGNTIKEMSTDKYPMNYSAMNLNGDDLISMGYKNSDIGKGLKLALDAIYSDRCINNKNDLLNYVKNNLQINRMREIINYNI